MMNNSLLCPYCCYPFRFGETVETQPVCEPVFETGLTYVRCNTVLTGPSEALGMWGAARPHVLARF